LTIERQADRLLGDLNDEAGTICMYICVGCKILLTLRSWLVYKRVGCGL